MPNPVSKTGDLWPALPLQEWNETYHILHMWTQIVGKIRLAQSPLLNHWWNVTLYVTSRGLTTLPMPYGSAIFEIEFDFIGHRLEARMSDGAVTDLPLAPQSVAEFYGRYLEMLRSLGVEVRLYPVPSEIANADPFHLDRTHASYDRDATQRCFRVLVQTDRVFKNFRTRFVGKCSPVHFFWGSFDLAVTRFSGRLAPPREGPAFMREAYSHEVISHGFWPGNEQLPGPVFYAYAVPEPEGFKEATVAPAAAAYNREMGEFLLTYEAVRTSADPDDALGEFIDSTYEAGAKLGKWDRSALEK